MMMKFFSSGLLLLLVSFSLNAQTVEIKRKADPPPLYIVDGKEVNVSGTEDLNKLIAAQNIGSIEVFKGEKAVALYGIRAMNGVIRINSKKPGEVKPSSVPPVRLSDAKVVPHDPEDAASPAMSKELIRITGRPVQKNSIELSGYIVMINDKVADSAQLAHLEFNSAGNNWNGEEILVIEVYRGKENAGKVFKGDLGNKKGVVVIRTRKKPV